MDKKTRIIEISDEILNHMLDYKKLHPDFTFSLRTRDSVMSQEKRLSKGQWFQGSDYIYVPLFKKGDNARKIKTIGFTLGFNDDASVRENYVEVSFKAGVTTENEIQFHKELAKKLNIELDQNRNGRVSYDQPEDYISNLDDFINNKRSIALELLAKHNLTDHKRYIISEEEFQKNLNRIKKIKENINPKVMNDSEYEEDLRPYIDLLKHKKQIILQGPPGTGKTYTAKKISQQLTGKVKSSIKLTPEIIKGTLKANQKIANASGKEAYYNINSIDENHVELQSDRSMPWRPKYENIITKYNELVRGIKPKNTNALDPYELAVAKYFFKSLKPESISKGGDYKIIQFHPSFTYEDFVRGITAKSEGDKVIYETENKIFATLADEALSNLNASKTDVKELSKQQHVEFLIGEFANNIQDIIDENESFPITSHVSIQLVENDAFRYTGDWKVSQRMKFKDLITAQINGVTTRQELKKLQGVSGLAKHHASYFIKVLNVFQKDFKKELETTVLTAERPDLRNYVLIIDEINRANLPAVLGELIYGLEYRNEPVESMYAYEDDNTIIIPDNLYIIGTMNTADRSVGHIDYAIKRRFAFATLLPNKSVISNEKACDLFDMVSGLFMLKTEEGIEASDYLASDFDYKDVQIGHSYFMLSDGDVTTQSKELKMRLQYEIVPLLREYVKDGLLLESATELINVIEAFEC